MTATLLGSFTVGDAIPGLRDVLSDTGQALDYMRDAVVVASSALAAAQSTINGLADDVDNAVGEVTTGALAEIQSQVDGAQLALNNLLTVTDPAAYLAGILGQLDDARTALEALIPADYLSDLISGANAAVDALQGKADALNDELLDLVSVAGLVRDQTAIIGEIRGALDDASAATLGALSQYVNQMSELLNSGVHVVSYNGALSSLGGEVDGVLPDTGLGASTVVAGPLLIVDTANTATLSALQSVFGL